MIRMVSGLVLILIGWSDARVARGAESSAVERVAAAARRSVVTLRQADRADGDGGVGTGFVVDDGMIATNFHVIGEGRAVKIEWPDGAVTEATTVHAWDRTMDLALLEGPPPEGKTWADFPPLELAPADGLPLPDGSEVMALGAPQGLTSSVAQGVLSARREVEDFPGVKMLQVAMPIEPGNSGGPLLDLEGRVHGVITLRSQRTANLGFALPVSAVQVLLARLDRPDVEVEAYRSRIARLGEELAGRIGAEAATASPESALARLNEFFFRENGFHAARFDYGNRANSRLPEVLDDREGIPIMLCALYMEIGRGAGLDLVGLPRAGHFVVGLRVAPDKPLMVIDVYDGGTILNEPETAALTPATVPEMVLRMLNNLQSFALDEDDRPAALRYASTAVALDPLAARLRLARAALALDQGEVALARDDLARLETTPLEVREQLLLERLRAAVPPL